MAVCIVEGCKCEREKGRKYCRKHYLERRKELRAKKKTEGKETRTRYKCVCLVCQKEFQGWRKDSLFCSRECFSKTRQSPVKNNYIYDSKNYKSNLFEHRNIVEKILGRKLHTNEVIHHIDCNPKNNNINNLLVISRSNHAKLHSYLNRMRVIIERSMNENSENCWNNLIASVTTTWLETTSVKVIKIQEIGQSAAEQMKI
jgi:hypothetical protein